MSCHPLPSPGVCVAKRHMLPARHPNAHRASPNPRPGHTHHTRQATPTLNTTAREGTNTRKQPPSLLSIRAEHQLRASEGGHNSCREPHPNCYKLRAGATLCVAWRKLRAQQDRLCVAKKMTRAHSVPHICGHPNCVYSRVTVTAAFVSHNKGANAPRFRGRRMSSRGTPRMGSLSPATSTLYTHRETSTPTTWGHAQRGTGRACTNSHAAGAA